LKLLHRHSQPPGFLFTNGYRICGGAGTDTGHANNNYQALSIALLRPAQAE
jgi:hypothetical protein